MARLRLFLAVQLVCLVHSLVLGQYSSYNYGFDISSRVKRQLAQRRMVVVNEKTGSAIQVRQEIRQLEQDKDLWTLYILGLSMMQFTDQSSPTSWYGITGIHGMPHQTWGGVGPSGDPQAGYCTHSSILFPTWHRPYLALYEQVLHSLIQTIATWWPDNERDRYVEAARRFRIPYWDWAATPPRGESVFPASVGGSPFVDVDGPNGRQRIANPLFSYTFKPLNATAFDHPPWDRWTRTLRSPSDSSGDAQSNNSRVALMFDQNRASIAQRLYALFSNYDDYGPFSNDAWGIEGHNTSSDSLESLHDTIHNLAGGGGISDNYQKGHMSYIQWSAFDPVFFLHHAMVDRIFALWQTLHPDTWITPTPAKRATYTTRRKEIEDASTALTPFFSHENGTFWTSDGVRDHTIFGYTYPELVQGGTESRVKQAINRLYGINSPATLFLRELRASGVKGNREMVKVAELCQHNVTAICPLTGSIFHGNQYREWFANVRVGRDVLLGPFSIHFFLGPPPEDPRAWTSAANHVGMMGVFAHEDHTSRLWKMRKMRRTRRRRRSDEDGHGHDDDDHGHDEDRSHDDDRDRHDGQADDHDDGHDIVSGTVPLTAALVKKVIAGELESLEPEHVHPYLQKNLERRVLGPFGTSVTGMECVRELRITVVSSIVSAPFSEDELPEWGSGKVHLQVC